MQLGQAEHVSSTPESSAPGAPLLSLCCPGLTQGFQRSQQVQMSPAPPALPRLFSVNPQSFGAAAICPIVLCHRHPIPSSTSPARQEQSCLTEE